MALLALSLSMKRMDLLLIHGKYGAGNIHWELVTVKAGSGWTDMGQ